MIARADPPSSAYSVSIASDDYAVVMTDKPLHHRDTGEPINGDIDIDAREIRISRACPPQQRLHTLLHEMAHGWFAALRALPETEEDWCDFFATVAAAAIRDVELQGARATTDDAAPQPMRFHVNSAIAYTVKIKPAASMAGLLGKFVFVEREIWIADKIKPEHRINILRHELSHAYDAHVGVPGDDESRADRFDAIAAGLEVDLAAQGGVAALEALQPEEFELAA